MNLSPSDVKQIKTMDSRNEKYMLSFALKSARTSFNSVLTKQNNKKDKQVLMSIQD